MQGLQSASEWLCVYLQQSLDYLTRSSVPVVAKQPPYPADKKIIYSYEIITSTERDACHQYPQANLQKATASTARREPNTNKLPTSCYWLEEMNSVHSLMHEESPGRDQLLAFQRCLFPLYKAVPVSAPSFLCCYRRHHISSETFTVSC